ncbi:MAG: CvpA family protein [Clostridia bacterium]|nr:CvpA family protein [Clostridia bacterium]
MIIDILLCLILVLTILVQYRRGALLALRGLLAFAGGSYVSARFQGTVSSFVYDRWVRDLAISKLKQQILSGHATDASYRWSGAVEKAYDLTADPTKIAEYVTDHTLRPSLYPAVELIVGFLLFLLTSLLLSLLIGALVRRVRQSGPAARGADSVFGAVFGVGEGLCIVLLLAVVLSVWPSLALTDGRTPFDEQLNQSQLVTFAGSFLLPYFRDLRAALS